MIGLLAGLVLATAAQSAQIPPPNPETREAVMRWSQCTSAQTGQMARGTAMSTEAIIAAALEACRQVEQLLERALAAQYGASGGALLAGMRDHARSRMAQGVAEIRGAPPVRGEGDEALVWGECTRRESAALARSTAGVDEIVVAVRRACAAEERTTRASFVRRSDTATADRTMASMLSNQELMVRETVADVRRAR